ncbi:hypothetical protein BDP27DRAFT_424984 [Rhodocollybia butyracea]|uniref:Ndc10 domain-containing protein n=1 Tax=Rhodocollybia butyracea TaxID=206335 RepID=A0A9P5UAP4_9AGAR|nr:hypothetical protein BDP27DRAFT_424984 [Rhodocollybia butyracea]
MDIDWTLNKSWRQVRILHGPSSLTTPFSEQSLYNLYVRAFQKANFDSPVKVHLPRHCLGYRQEGMGVESVQTSKLGWSRGSMYHDVYAPSIPVKAVLGAAGYKAHESYDPIWRHIRVPEAFLLLMCPMAEEIHESIVGKKNLNGAANFWKLIIDLRPYLFQCGASIFQQCPESALFKLPALANNNVRNWMKTTFLSELSVLRASAGSPIDLQRIQNESLRQAIEEMQVLLTSTHTEIRKLSAQVDHRTQLLSPQKSSFPSRTVIPSKQLSFPASSSSFPLTPIPVNWVLLPAANIVSTSLPLTKLALVNAENDLEETALAAGVYQADDTTFRAYVSPSL